MGFSFHPNAVIGVAALLTIGLGAFYCQPPPAGPDRAMIGIVCFLAQTPRWICMAILLGLCVAKGAFVWPESRATQYLMVFALHLAIGFGAICAGLAGLGMTSPSRKLLVATAPAIAPVVCKNSLRETGSFFMSPPRKNGTAIIALLWKRLDRHFLEKDNVVVAMVLKSEVAFVRPRTTLRFEIKLLLGDGLAFGVVGHFNAIH